MKHSIKYIFYALLSILWASIGINSISAQEKDDFFTIKNSNAIRDSLNLIKFVNPNEAERFAFEILEKYPDKKPNRVQASTYAALGQIYHIKGLTGPTIEYFDQSERLFNEAMGSVPPWILLRACRHMCRAEPPRRPHACASCMQPEPRTSGAGAGRAGALTLSLGARCFPSRRSCSIGGPQPSTAASPNGGPTPRPAGLER